VHDIGKNLVEIILGRNTGDVALATALDYVRQIGKTPIVVNDSRGFFANRCVLRFTAEGLEMLMEGVPPAMIENVARAAGMPVGPLALNDEVAIDLSWKLAATLAGWGGPNLLKSYEIERRQIGAAGHRRPDPRLVLHPRQIDRQARHSRYLRPCFGAPWATSSHPNERPKCP